MARLAQLKQGQVQPGVKMYKKGGAVEKLKNLFKGKEDYAEEVKEAKAIKSGKITPAQYAKGEKMEEAKKGMKKGGMCKPMKKGGMARKGCK